MQSGKMRTLLSIQRSTNGTWATVSSVWAKVETTSGSEWTDPQTGHTVSNISVLTRRNHNVTPKDRFLYGARYLYIQSITPDRTDSRLQSYDCIEEVL